MTALYDSGSKASERTNVSSDCLGVQTSADGQKPAMTFRMLLLLIVASCIGVAVFVAYRSWEYRCQSHRRGFLGEVMRQDDGKLLYFNGECWTTREMPPTDSPF